MKKRQTVKVRHESEVSDGLRMLTCLLQARTLKDPRGGFLGGSFGYGVDFENDVFGMFPFYWGEECTCGYVARWEPLDAAWCAEHKHSEACYQTELDAREKAWDVENRREDIEALAFGRDATIADRLFRPTKKSAMDLWREVYDKRKKFQESLYNELTARYGLSKLGCACHCTCGYDKLRAAWCATDRHDWMCPIVRPNFWHKRSGLKIEWYKYIGRDNEFSGDGEIDWRDVLSECVMSLGMPSMKDAEDEFAAAQKSEAERFERSMEFMASEEGQAMMQEMEDKGIIQTFVGGVEIDDESDKDPN